MSAPSRPESPLARAARAGRIDPARLLDGTRARDWGVTVEAFRPVIDASIAHAFGARPVTPPSNDAVERYVAGLHLPDLVLACACAAGDDAAWNHFVREYRPALYRAADAIDPGGGAREIADALYADLYGLRERDGVRQSLFRYFHGRSSLSTWLRAVLSQRHIDRLRAGRRTEPLPDDDASSGAAALTSSPHGLDAGAGVGEGTERGRFLGAMRLALAAAIAALAPRDRLRLSAYYAQDLTLAAIGRLLGEHEATVSRHLSRTRRAVRADVELRLGRDHGFDAAQVAECFRSVAHDPGPLDLSTLLPEDRK